MRFLNIFLLLTSILALTSCKEEIDILGTAKESAVVYSVLDVSDSVHYVKVTKAFLTSKDPYDIAKIADSNYFENVVVTIKEFTNGNNTRTWTLKDTTINTKEDGAFYSPAQNLFYFRTNSQNPLIAQSNVTYKLNVNINNEFEVTGETKLVSGVSISSPSSIQGLTFATNNVSEKGYASSSIKFSTGTSEILDLRMNIGIDEYRGADLTEKTVTWKINEMGGADLNTTSKTVLVNGESFYNYVKNNVTDDALITKRQLRNIELVLTAGHPDLYKYILVSKPSSSITQSKMTFTNLSATNERNVVGIFSSRTTVKQDKPGWYFAGGSLYIAALNPASMRELCKGQITGLLKFCSSNPSDQLVNPDYFCQ